jgi:glycosyltransferase involved in cell wall biosynthesis
VVRHDVNTGHVITFNDGLTRATGEFIVRLDADDLLTPGSLARAVALFDAFPSVGLVYGHPRHFTTQAPPPARTRVRGWTVWTGESWIAERCRQGVNCITTPEAMVRASVFEAVGALDTRLRHAQDMEMWLRAASVGDVGRVDGADQALHRDHDSSMSVALVEKRLIDLGERRLVFDLALAAGADRLRDADRLRETAHRALAVEALESACHAYDRGKVAGEDVDDYVAFAVETYPRARELRHWRALEWRRRVGPRWAPYVPTFFASVVWRRLRRDAYYRRWVRAGV